VKLRFVFDTNVYVAATLAPGKYAEKYLNLAQDGVFTLLVSNEILVELKHKVSSKFPERTARVNDLILNVRSYAELVETTTVINLLEDKPDNRILECAVDGEAHVIVSFDKDLLRLKDYRGIGIMHPAMLQTYFPE
jgi:uncharacterized protein